MIYENLKVKERKKYNPVVSRTVKREMVGNIKCYIKAVKPNPINIFGVNMKTMYPDDYKIVYYYKVGANDGSYRKCTTREDAERQFAQLVQFEKRQTEIEIQ